MNLHFWGLLIGMVPSMLLQCNGLRQKDYSIKTVPLLNIEIQDNFWQPRLETNRTVTIPHCFHKIEGNGGIDNFASAAGLIHRPFQGRVSSDAELYKVMEGAFYVQVMHPDVNLANFLDSLSILIAEAQEDDGYLYTARTVDPANSPGYAGPTRWSNLAKSHELYNAGHLYEAADAAAIEGRNPLLLNVARKNIDLIDHSFEGREKITITDHQEIELALIKMFRLTGEQRYLDLARSFLEARGQPRETLTVDSLRRLQYAQTHLPVKQQFEAVGHAVRGTYMYTAMADIAALDQDQAYEKAVEKIWWDIVEKKMYLTGGVGSNKKGEAFGQAYELPNLYAYNETCAAIGYALFSQRMFQIKGDARYIDVFERILYNGFLASIGLGGDQFFYLNPLQSDGTYPFNKGKASRQEWFSCPCCPTNIARFIPNIPSFIYATGDNEIFINLFVKSSAKIDLPKNSIRIVQNTNYPWDGQIKLAINPENTARFTIKIRIPGWMQNKPVPGDLYHFSGPAPDTIPILVNNQPIHPTFEKGFAVLNRKWQKGDKIEVRFSMPVCRVISHEKLVGNRGKVAIQRGPLVYCAEQVDNGNIAELRIPDNTEFIPEFRPDMLNGITLLKTKGGPSAASDEITLVPYYSWSNRGVGQMAVWLPQN